MSYQSPFTKSDKPSRHAHPALSLLGFVVMLYVPVFVAGYVCKSWCLSFFLATLFAAFLLAGCLVSLLSARAVRELPILAKPLTRLALLMACVVILLAPIALFPGTQPHDSVPAAPMDNPIVATMESFYAALKAVGLDTDPGELLGPDGIAEGIPYGLLCVHAALTIICVIASPLAAVFAAFDAVVNGMAGMRIWFWSWRKSYGRTEHEIYVFHELDENGSTLAQSIIEERGHELPLIIFANVGDMDASRDDTLMEDLLDRAQGRAFVLFTSLPAESIPAKLSDEALKRCTIRYFAISESSTTNIQTAVRLWDTVFELLWNETWHREEGLFPKDTKYATRCAALANGMEWFAKSDKGRKRTRKDKIPSFDTAVLEPIVELGERMSIHCLYAHPDDGAILDNLANRSVERIAKHLADGILGDERENLLEGVRTLAKCLRSLVEIRLLSQTQLAVYDLFARHPLYEALDPIDLVGRMMECDKGDPVLDEQILTVLILGCGTYGTEALKAAFWLGRFPGTQLRIVVVEQNDVRKKMEHLYLECPGLMTERTYTEDPHGPYVGKWSIAERHDAPTVRFCEMDAFGLQMQDLLEGRSVHSLWYQAGKVPTIVEGNGPVLTKDDRLYCVVCLDDDSSCLNAALDLQRSLAIRNVRIGRKKDRIPIALRVRNDEVLSSGQLGKHGLQSTLWTRGFPLRPFGALSTTFTYDLIAKDKIEEQALHTNAAYSNAHLEYPSPLEGRMGYYGLPEMHRMSNRSSALYIPTRLWMLGFCPDEDCPEAYQDALGNGAGPNSNEVFRRGLVLPRELVDGTIDGPGDDDWILNTASDKEFRRQWPLLSYVADMEHVRWSAFYRATGWRDVLSLLDYGNDDLLVDGLESDEISSSLDKLEEIRRRIDLTKDRQHIDLKLHYYLCDNIDELAQRGRDCNDHPFAYDRIIVWLSVNILQGTVCPE